MLELLLLEARPVVRDRELDLLADLAGRQPDLGALRRVLVRVRQQIEEHLADSAVVGFDVRQVLLDTHGEALVLLLEVRPHLPADPLGQGSDRGRLRLDPKLARVAARQVEQVVDHLLQVSGAFRDHLRRLELPRVERLPLRGQHLREALDHGHRSAELVRDGEHEVVLHLLDPVSLASVALERVRHLVEGAAQGCDLDRAADLHPGLQVTAREAARSRDQAAERRAHRVDQAREEDQGGEQGAGEPGRDQDGGVAGLPPGVVARVVPGVAGLDRQRLAAVGHRRGEPPLDRRRRARSRGPAGSATDLRQAASLAITFAASP